MRREGMRRKEKEGERRRKKKTGKCEMEGLKRLEEGRKKITRISEKKKYRKRREERM